MGVNAFLRATGISLILILLLQSHPGLAEDTSSPCFSLRKAVEWAWEHNHQVLIATEKLNELKGRIKEEKSAVFPTLDFNGAYRRFRDPGILNSSSFKDIPEDFAFDLTPEAQNIYDMSMSFEQTLISWGKISTALKIARLALDSGQKDLATAKAEIGLEVAQGYFDALLAREVLGALKKSEEHAKKNLEVTSNRYEVGEATNLDLLRAKAALSKLGPELLEAEQGIRESVAALNRLLGRPIDAPLALGESLAFKAEEIPVLEAIQERALKARSEIGKLRLERGILARTGSLARTDLRPSLKMNGAFGISTAFADHLLDSDFLSWNVGLNFSVPVFDGGRVKGQLRQVQAQLEQNDLGLADTLNSISLEVEVSRNRVVKASEGVRASKVSLDAAEEAFRVAEELYAFGAATSLDVLDFERERRSAEVEYKSALHEYSVALAELKRIMEIPVFEEFGYDEPGG